MKDVLIHGLYLKSFKGIGDEGVRLFPLQKINFLAGPNNSGKSSILQFLSKYLHGGRKNDWTRSYSKEDVPIGKSSGDTRFGFGAPVPVVERRLAVSGSKKLLEELSKDGYIWVVSNDGGQGMQLLDWENGAAEGILVEREWNRIWSELTNMTGGSRSTWVSGVLGRVGNTLWRELPSVRLIPAIRQISSGDALSDFSGAGLVNEIAKLQNPDFHNQELRNKFKAIERFVRIVTGEGDATIEVPYERTHLVVHMGGKALPLAALGTGIHEIIMLAAFCTLAENEIVCLEEPEIHLHPLLQRKLIRYLFEQTTNQYFIATHSSAMLDAVRGAVFSVTQSKGVTHIRLASTPSDRFELCRVLGYQASDLLQSNAIVWVEGPSDRIYLLHWIGSVAPDLVEGIDFSIMFYGGRLLSHLSAMDEEVTEFISLRKLNRNIAIVIDSDKVSKSAKIGATKRRIVDELLGGCVWVTAGREIENYVAVPILTEVFGEVCGEEFGRRDGFGQFDRVLSYTDKKGKHQVADKIKFARAVVRKDAELDVLDLKRKIANLVSFIRKASGGADD